MSDLDTNDVVNTGPLADSQPSAPDQPTAPPAMGNVGSDQAGSAAPSEIQGPPSPQARLAAGAAAQPTPQVGGSWKDVVVGALKGMAKGFVLGGVPGAVEGAIAPKYIGTKFAEQQALEKGAVQEQQAKINFTNGQAAESVARAHLFDEQAQNIPKQMQFEIEKSGQEFAKALMASGVTPLATTTGDEGSAMAGLQSAAQASPDGKVPDMMILPLPGGQHIAFNRADIANSGAATMNLVNLFGPLVGIPKGTTFAQIKNTPSHGAQQQKLLEGIMMPTAKSYQEAQGKIDQYTNFIDGVKNGQYDVQDKEATLGYLENGLAVMQATHDKLLAQATSLRQAASNNRIVKVTLPDGSIVNMHAVDTLGGGKGGGISADASGALFSGYMPDHTVVAGSPAELKAAGATVTGKMTGASANMVTTARQIVAPNGLMQDVAKVLAAYKPEEINGVVNHWKDFLQGKYATDPKFGALYTSMHLLDSAVMQAHVGLKSSEGMLNHFARLANLQVDDYATLKSQLSQLHHYMVEKAAFPPVRK